MPGALDEALTDSQLAMPGDLLPDDLLPEDLLSDTTIERRRSAAAAKAQFEAFIKGSTARVGMLGRDRIPGLGFAVADLMLMQLVTGRLKPKTAKEAIDIADKALNIARRETGDVDTTVAITTPAQRAAAVAAITDLAAMVRARAAASDQAAPVEPDYEDAEVVEDSELAAELEAGAAAGTPVRSATGGAVLGRVRPAS